MLEVRTSPARRRPRVVAALRRIAAAIATGAAFAGCVAPPDQGTDTEGPDTHPASAPAGYGQELSALYEPCIAGAWITPPRACACPAARDPDFTPECTASDCQETDLLLMSSWGDAVSAALRYSGDRQGLSAVGGDPREGTWSYHDDGELRLELDGNAIYTPTECDDGELQMKAHPLMTHPPAALDAAIFWAWLLDEWTDVPYFP